MTVRRWPLVRRPNLHDGPKQIKADSPWMKHRRRHDLYDLVSIIPLVVFLLGSPRIKRRHGLSTWQRLKLCWLMYDNTKMIKTGTSFRAHVAMAVKLLEMDPKIPGVVVECGCWKGGTSTNLSLVCDLVGRDLIVYDSFAGLPEPAEGDKYARDAGTGFFKGELEEVMGNVRRYGKIDRVDFRKGWFSDTLPHHTEPVVMAYLDVDYQASMHDCMLGLWPHLVDQGYLFVDEYTRLDYCGLFYSEKYWRTYFDTTPPGIMGSGAGIGVGQYFLGPLSERTLQERPASLAFTRKDFDGLWDYYPEDAESESTGVETA